MLIALTLKLITYLFIHAHTDSLPKDCGMIQLDLIEYASNNVFFSNS